MTVNVDHLTMREGGVIRASNFGPGRGGDVRVTADTMLLEGVREGDPTGLFAQATTSRSTGDAGDLTVNVDRLTMRDGAAIGVSTFGAGRGGDLRIMADTMLLEGIREGHPTGLFASTGPGSTGDAGDLAVNVDHLTMREGAVIRASTFGAGRGGDLTVTADTMFLEGVREGHPTGLSAQATTSRSTGDAGNITVKADRLQLREGATISVETAQSNAGNATLDVGSLLHLRDSSITTSVAGGQGDGGNISIDPVFTVLDGGSRIIARARQGRGGNIRIVSDFLFVSPESLIDASSELGVSGVVDVESPETDVVSGALALPESFLDAASLLSDRCTARAIKGASSFIVSGRGGVPPGPETVLPSFPELGLHEAPKAKGSASVSENALAQGSTPIDCAIE